MTGRAQNSAKGRFQKNVIVISASGEFWGADYSTSAKAFSFDANGIVLAGGVTISNAQLLTANSTGLKFTNYGSDLPGNVDNGALFGMISNSTGVALFINSTGTTHKYIAVTTKFPT